MSKIYTINNSESELEQIPTMAYVSELIKLIEDKIINNDADFSGFPSIKTTAEELPIGLKQLPIISAYDIVTDSEHRFINEGLLTTMVDKPTKFEVQQLLSEVKEELKTEIIKTYMRIINTPNVINKLRDISVILNEDEIVNGLLNTLSYKLNMDEFEEHANSSIHLNNNDRKALNVLIKCMMGGFADWDAVNGAPNAIKNKPESLPANGGNADTVANHDIKDLINKEDYDIVIGRDNQKYSKDSCDIYAEDGYIDFNILEKLIKSITVGSILFKKGEYSVKYIDCLSSSIIFTGIDRRLVTIKVDAGNFVNSVVKNTTFKNSTIYIRSNCEFIDCTFDNCQIILNNSIGCNIIGNIFDHCTIKPEGTIMNNIIKFNRYIKTNPIKYIGCNNIITENIH